MHFYTSYTPKTWELGIGFGRPHPDYKLYTTELYVMLGPFTLTLQLGVREERS